jgi:hypothetical protein
MSFVSAGTELFGYAVSTSGNVIKLHISLVGIEAVNNEIPNSFVLAQNYPNPFNPATNIKFSVPTAGLVKIAIYDVLGNQVAVIINENLNVGNYKSDFNAYELSSGIYFYKMFSGEFKETKKMILIK